MSKCEIELEKLEPTGAKLIDVESNFALSEAILDASNMQTIYGVPIFCYYWDRDQRACLMLDPYNFTGSFDTREEDFVYEHAERFVRLPTFTSSDIFQLMVTFAAETDTRLSRALEAKYPMNRFNDVAHEIGLYDDWQKYRNDYLREIYLKWCKRHGIDPDFSF